MSYILERTDPQVLQKILSDSQTDSWVAHILTRWNHLKPESMPAWAVDRENDSYLFYGPTVGEPGSYEYTFYFAGNFYHLRIRSHYIGLVEYMHPLQHSRNAEVERAISDAFQAFGKYGFRSNGSAPSPLVVKFRE